MQLALMQAGSHALEGVISSCCMQPRVMFLKVGATHCWFLVVGSFSEMDLVDCQIHRQSTLCVASALFSHASIPQRLAAFNPGWRDLQVAHSPHAVAQQHISTITNKMM